MVNTKKLTAYTDENTVSMDDYLNKLLANPSVKEAYQAEYNKLASAVALVQAREDAGMSQAELAKKANLPQSTITRIERGNNTSIETLTKIAIALNKHVTISFS